MRKSIAVLCMLALAAGFWCARGDAEQPNQVGIFMRAKLDHSQRLLEGITLEDFELIERNAQALSLLSQEASWRVLQTPDYLQHSVEFRRSADALAEAARKKNLDGAALGFVDMTMKCVNCHKYVRGVRMAKRTTDMK